MYREKKNEKSVTVIEPENPPVEFPAAETDLAPEFCHYKDEGCELAAACLHCPLPRCVYEQPWGRFKWTKSLRDREIVRLYTQEKKTFKELAVRFKVCRRTVQRALKSAREGSIKNSKH